MSTVEVSLRLSGMLPPSEHLTELFGVQPTRSLRQGDRASKRRVQPVDLWQLDLAMIQDGESLDQQLHEAAIQLKQLAPEIAKLDRSTCQAELYISTIREEDQGGFSLPVELISAAADAQLSIELSILVMLDDYVEPELNTHVIACN
ncbi:hypothetical protein LEP3755_48060 [Leptolyngbya sp. NIES-3755]|nr:hypothetical protein LEP3755_48060 [Leptolyngbya sp. NIES-3755]